MSGRDKNKGVLFLGGGNMAASLIAGMIDAGFSSKRIQVAEPQPARAEFIANQYKVQIGASLHELEISNADALILAVKPQVLLEVLNELSGEIPEGLLLISIAAGITCEQISAAFKRSPPIVRCMPNTPAMVGAGMSGLYQNQRVTEAQHLLTSDILAGVGECMWVDDEYLLNGVTATSGSGPAYFFYIMEGMVKGAMSTGLTEDQGRALVLQTALGAAKLAAGSDQSLESLRKQVTSKGGTTEAGINVFTQDNTMDTIAEVVKAAFERSIELSTK